MLTSAACFEVISFDPKAGLKQRSPRMGSKELQVLLNFELKNSILSKLKVLISPKNIAR